MENRRRYLRIASDALVEMSHPGFGTVTVQAHDLSEGGIAVTMGNYPVPPVGTVFKVIIKRHTGAINAEPVDMKVVHTMADGSKVGLMFI